MRWVFIDEGKFEDAAAFHAYLADELDFPDYYGCNLDALNDCLGDIDDPVCFVIGRTSEPQDGEQRTWFDRACTVLYRSARDNDAISVMDAEEFGEIPDNPDDID